MTLKEFADLCEMPVKNIYTYIHRGQVVLGKNDEVNPDIPQNKTFLLKRKSKKSKKQDETIQDFYNNDDDDDDSFDKSGTMPLDKSTELLQYRKAIKAGLEVEKLELDIQKKRGEVIPSELIPPVILQHNQSIITSIKNEFDEWLRNHAKRYDLGVNEIAEIRTQAVQWINTGMNKATAMSVRAVENIVKDYQDKRGVGERL